VRTHLRRHLDQFAGPVLIITHDPLEAMIMADRLLVIENGRVVQQGSPAQVASHPATQYVARLVGRNLYTGTLEVATRRVFLDAGGTFTVTLSEDDPTASAPDGQSTRPVLVGLRPSAITVHTALPTHGSPHNAWKGTVTGLDQLTDRVQVDATPPPRQPLSTSPPRPWPTSHYDPAAQYGSRPKPPRPRRIPTPVSIASRDSSRRP
jgi:molybdate transport system ATP-binding protein